MTLFKKNQYFYCFLIFFLFFRSAVFAEMEPVSDTELESVTGQAFSNFIYQEYDRNGSRCIKMQLDLDMKIEVRTIIENIRMGYYNWGGDTGVEILGGWYYGNGGGNGWNISIDNLQIGQYNNRYGDSANVPFVLDGLTIRTDYTIDGSGNKVLNTFAIGTDHADGWVYAQDFWSYTGIMMTNLSGDTVIRDVGGIMENWVYRTSVLNPSTLLFVYNFDIAQTGMHFQPGTNTEGMYLVIDKDIGIGLYAGPPIADLYNYWP